MADFRTHVTTSSVLGMGYAGVGAVMGMPIDTCVVAGGLCGVSGMLPDLDSDSGIPLREAMGFSAAVIPMLLVERFEMMGLRHDVMIIITAALYFGIRFGGANIVSKFSVHRGMFHSIPAVLIFAGIAFIITDYADIQVRYFKAGGVLAGAMSHLILDELYAIEWKGGRWRFKKSFGTAIKFFGRSGWANFSTYAKLAVVATIYFGEPAVMQRLYDRYPRLAERVQRYKEFEGDVAERLGLDHSTNANSQSPSLSTEPNDTPARLAPTSPELTSQPPIGRPPLAPVEQPALPYPSAPPTPAPSGGGFAPNNGSGRWDQAMRPGPAGL